MENRIPHFHADRIWRGPFAVWQTGTTQIVFRSDSREDCVRMAAALTAAAAAAAAAPIDPKGD